MITFFDFWVSKRYLFPKTKDSFFSLITILSFLGISLGVATLIIVMSVMNGFREELTNKVLGINGHIKIQLYNSSKITKYESIINSLNNFSNELDAQPVIITQSLLSTKNFSSGVILKGLKTKDISNRKLLKQKISDESFKKFDNNEGVLVGKKLFQRLSGENKKYIKLISSKQIETPFGRILNSQDFKIIGTFETGMYDYDLNLIILPLNLLQKFLNEETSVHSIEVFMNDFGNIEKTIEDLHTILPDYFSIVDWRRLNPTLFNAIAVERNVMFIILLLIIVVAAFNLISSLIMLVNNKKKDIGILRTLGVSKTQLLKIFILNGFFIGFIGTVLGLILGILFCQNINQIKDFFELFMDSDLFSEEIYFFSQLPIIIDFKEIILIVIISLLLSFVATIYPAYKASKVEPIHLIKWE